MKRYLIFLNAFRRTQVANPPFSVEKSVKVQRITSHIWTNVKLPMVEMCSISPSKALMIPLLLGLLLFVWLSIEQHEVTKIRFARLVQLRGKSDSLNSVVDEADDHSRNEDQALLPPTPPLVSTPSALLAEMSTTPIPTNASHPTGNQVKGDDIATTEASSADNDVTLTNEPTNEFTTATEADSQVTSPSITLPQTSPPTSDSGDSNIETTNHPTTRPSELPQTTSPTKKPSLTQKNQPTTSLSSPNQTVLHNVKYSEIWRFFRGQPLTYERIPELFPQPDSDDFELAGIYSRSAWSKLRHMLNTSDVTMLVTGASTVAGGGGVPRKDRLQTVFAQLYHNVTVVDRCHGSRSTFHSAQNMHSYFPIHADMVLWEFAINDPYTTADIKLRPQELQNQLMLYLEQVARVAKERQQEPPLVILLYLWSLPFGVSAAGKVRQDTFDFHQHVAEKYDFVVGYVNAAKYFASWRLDNNQTKAFALADAHHPNVRGHMMIAYLLNDLVMNEQRPDKPKEVNQMKTSFRWVCGEETEKKRLMRDLLVNRHPVASYTTEIPKNDDILAGMLTPPTNAIMDRAGKDDPVRSDKQYYTIFPCCGVDNLSFNVSRYSPLQGIEISVSPATAEFIVLLDGKNVVDKRISTEGWGCLSAHWAGSKPQNWVVLEQPRNVSVVSFCDNSRSCRTRREVAASISLFSMTAYGGKRNVKFATTRV